MCILGILDVLLDEYMMHYTLTDLGGLRFIYSVCRNKQEVKSNSITFTMQAMVVHHNQPTLATSTTRRTPIFTLMSSICRHDVQHVGYIYYLFEDNYK